MAQTISRMFDSRETADKAAEALRRNSFVRFQDVFVVCRHGAVHTGTDAPALSADGIVEALMAAYVLKSHAKIYAQGIQRGGALVTVHAPFGTAKAAIAMLQDFGPIDSGIAEVEDRPMAWDEAAPCSSALQMPVRMEGASPFSDFWGLPVLTAKGGPTSTSLGMPLLSDSSKPFTGTFGMALISGKSTILSSALGLPVLTKRRTG